MDRILHRDHGLGAEDVIKGLPSGLLSMPTAVQHGVIADSDEIALTVAAVDATGQGRHELDLFLSVVRQVAEVEHHNRRTGCSPTLAGSTIADQWDLLDQEGEARLARVGALLCVELASLTTVTNCHSPAWAIETNRRLRDFRVVATVAQYWAKRSSLPRYRADAAADPATVIMPSSIETPLSRNRTVEGTDSRRLRMMAVQVSVTIVMAVFAGVAIDLNIYGTVAAIGAVVAGTLLWWSRSR